MDASAETSLTAGLSADEARCRLAQFGPNSLPAAKPPSLLEWLTELIREPVLILLLNRKRHISSAPEAGLFAPLAC